ncbi:Hint domain-containing protein [Streptomyces sp. PanSC19]|uniref:Hint domain-containing protein n=1 Tax=Streptomyces sp. PanSC19 TaxID=1520455 RepID=UPI000F48D39C|nr:Hint domain-containing protein [Streptomyces sp. PanSC19]
MVGLVLVALVAGLLSLTSSSSDSNEIQAARRDLQPFRAAVDNLADAPGLRYKDTSAFGITENDITVTASGSQFGTTSSGRKENGRGVLRIGGKTFMRWEVDPAPRQEVKAGEKAPPSEWMVGMDDGSSLTNEALARTIAPSKLAAVLAKALDDLEKSPPPANEPKTSNKAGQRPLSVNGTPALGIDTAAGRLLVTKAKPHRVLRLEAYDLREDLADMKEQLENGEVLTAPRKVTTGPLASGDGEGMDLTPIVADDAVAAMFDTLVEYADQLKDATDHGINFTLDGAGEMDCSPSGCTATQNFTGEVSSIARKERVTKGEVTAVMSATFSIDGKPAGQCTSPQRTFPLRGNTVSGTLTCSNPGAGPLYASVAARVQAQAQADADRCGCRVRLTYPVRANTLIDARALAKVEAEKLADQAKSERDAAACVKPHSFPAGTQVLLAGGTTRAIEDIRIGDRVAASDPQVQLPTARPVTNTFTTEGDKDFTLLTVATEQGPATVTATDNHPFWLADDQRWKNAGDLRVGDELRTPNGASVVVTEVRDQQGQRRTFDLTVSRVHTYYVIAGHTPVLVHNANNKKCSLQIDHVGQVDQDWVTKGAHVNMKDGMEVALRPDGRGGIRGEAIRLRNGTATQKQVDAVVESIKSDPKVRSDMIRVTESAKEVFESSAKAMKEGRKPQWRFNNDRTAELQALIDAMEKM